MLQTIKGDDANFLLMMKSFEKTPSLIIDCANCCDPHKLFGRVLEEELCNVYVMNAEAIYRFRDTLRQVPYWINKLGIKRLFVTTIGNLYSYDDEYENHHVITHCWEIMQELSKQIPVYVAIH